ncbi:very short patch repair endonuclease [Mycolicibacterium porcinum]
METPSIAGAPSASGSATYVTSPGRSRNMAAIRRKDTKPEVALRSALHRHGLRFRKDYPLRIEGRLIRPDIAFTRRKIAVFIDGCFWHCCPEHGRQPGVNSEYWSPKLQGNVERDRQQTAALQNAGWYVIRFWEHEEVASVFSALTDLISPDRNDSCWPPMMH